MSENIVELIGGEISIGFLIAPLRIDEIEKIWVHIMPGWAPFLQKHKSARRLTSTSKIAHEWFETGQRSLNGLKLCKI